MAVVTPPTAVAVAVVGSDGNRNCFQSVYFSFDDSLLGDATRASLQQVADCLRHQTASHYVLMGHADPRGSTEYNLALGERRARSVENYLVSLGVDGRRLAESSDGSEDAMGTNEASWAHDRRADSHSTSTNNTTATMP